MKTADWKYRYNFLTSEAAAVATQLSRNTMGQPVYCYVKEADGDDWGELEIVLQGKNAPAGFKLLTGERFPCHKPYSTWADFIRQASPRIIGA